MKLWMRVPKSLRLAAPPIVLAAAMAAYLLAEDGAPAMDEPAVPPALVADAAVAPAATAASDKETLSRAVATFRDPFQNEGAAFVDLEATIRVKQKEIEVLKLALEEKNLRAQLSAPDSTPVTAVAARFAAAGGDIEARAVIHSEKRRAVLLAQGERATWVNEGGRLDSWLVVRVGPQGAVVDRDGERRTLAVNP